MRKGKHSEARNYLRRCVDVTHEMALQLIQACRAINVDCVVAPYEADGQLAFLNRAGIADYVVTEDSDLVLFGCSRILFKLDLTGQCTLVEADKLHLAMGCRAEKFSMEKFRFMCILSGCDYVDSLPGIGLVKACKFVTMTEETDMMRALDKIPAYLNKRNLVVTDEYKLNVMKANATFQHMVVYDPIERKQTRLNDVESAGTEEAFCCNAGTLMADEEALDLAVGNLNPFSLKRLDNWHPDRRQEVKSGRTKSAKHPSIWQKSFKTVSKNSKMQQISIEKTLTRVQRKPTNIRESSAVSTDNENSSEENSEDLINQYINEKSPPLKKFKCSEPKTEPSNGDVETTPSQSSRNPFKRSSNTFECVEETTEITSLNSSLIKNQSPVKCIDFRKLEKLSKFNRTVISRAQNTVSRFFSEEVKSIETMTSESLEADEQKESEEESRNRLYLNTSSDAAVSPCSEKMPPTDPAPSTTGGSQSPLTESSQQSESNAYTSDHVSLISSDESNQGVSAFEKMQPAKIVARPVSIRLPQLLVKAIKLTNSSELQAKMQTKGSSRGLGLSRKRSSQKLNAKSDPKTFQCKLSMFGFEKRAQIKQ